MDDETLWRIARRTSHISFHLGTQLGFDLNELRALDSKHDEPAEQAFDIILVSKHA